MRVTCATSGPRVLDRSTRRRSSYHFFDVRGLRLAAYPWHEVHGTRFRRDTLKRMIDVKPIVLEGKGIRLEPLASEHEDGLTAAAADGRLWELWYTSVPAPGGMGAYIAEALAGQQQGHMLPWAVRDLANGEILGSTRYHDI